MAKAGREAAGAGPGVGAVEVCWGEGASGIALDAALLRRAGEAVGGPGAPALPGRVQLDAEDPLAALAALLVPGAGGPAGPLADAGVRRGLMEALARGLLLRGMRPAAPQPPRRLLRAEARLAGGGEGIDLGALAQAVGVGPRTLQRDFSRWRGCTPSAARVALRLEGARARLLAPSAGLTVTEVALGAGYGTPSRFSAAYRARFGEPPGATLRAARARGAASAGED